MSSDLVVWLAHLRKLSEVAVSGAPMTEALNLVAKTAQELIPLDFCGVLIPDQAASVLVIAGWSGLSDEYVDGVNRRNPVGLGSTAPSSRAYYGGAPVVVADIAAESGFKPWGGVAHEQGYSSMISVPLLGDSGVLGTLNGYHAQKHEYTHDEIERMTLLANHAAAAIASAGLLDELRRTNETLVDQRDLLTRSQAIREELLQASLESRGSSAVVRSLERIVRRPVLFSDDPQRPLPAPPDGALVRHPIHVEGEQAGELIIGVRAGTPAGADHLDKLEEVAIGHAAAVLTLELLRQRTARETEYRIAGELLQDVLSVGITESSLQRARAMGFDLTQLGVAMVITLRPTTEPPATARLRTGILSRLARTQLATSDGSAFPLVTEYRGKVVALWPSTLLSSAAADVSTALATAFPSTAVLVASSGTAKRTLAEAVRVARGVHDVAESFGRTGAVDPADLGFVGVMLQMEETRILTDFVDLHLGPVISYDQRKGTELIRTLRTYIRNDVDRAATASELRVHPNTVQQRLRRIESLTGSSFDTPRSLLDLTAASTMYGLGSESGSR
ncbi:GAF domain-containing protein [Microbacterium sp. P04]|uniref:helix-turn-helix domain-containing protein n=1 Tax=Microbacterium sp. P04 TaxID=3366947 RepID=UPI0037472754